VVVCGLLTSEYKPPFIAVKNLEGQVVSRFTQLSQALHGRPGVTIPTCRWENGERTCWIGPLMMARSMLSTSYHRTPGGFVSPAVSNVIEHFILDCTDNGKLLTPIYMNCSDLGVPEAL